MDSLTNIIKSIKVDVYGQADNDTKHVFTYPDAFNPALASEKDNWLRAISDPRDARAFTTDEVYAYMKNQFGNYYSIIVPNRQDTRNGLMMVTVFTDAYMAADGKAVITALQRLKRLAEGEPDRNYVAHVVEDLAGHLTPDGAKAHAPAAGGEKTFRRYKSDMELAEIFQFTDQAEYAGGKRLLIVPAEAVPAQLPAGYKEITEKIKKSYIIKNLPTNVSTSKTHVQDGDTLEITYRAQGCAPTTLSFTVGKTYKELYYSGSEIIVHDAQTAGVTLQRRIRLNIMSEDGRAVGGCKVWCNNQNCDVKDGYITLPALNGRSAYHITVSAYGYKQEKFDLTEEDMAKGAKNIRLKTDMVRVHVKLYVKGYVKEGYVNLNGNDPLLPYLKEAQDDELNKHKFNTVYGADGRPMADGKTKDGHGGGKKPSKAKQLLALIGGLIVALYILYAIIAFAFGTDPWPFGGGKDKQLQQTEQSTDNPYVENDENAGEQQADGNTQENIDHDVAWMKSHDTWFRDSLLTQKYMTLCDYIERGQVEEIMKKEPWFDMDNPKHYNGHWLNITKHLTAINDDLDKVNKAVTVMKDLSRDGRIDLQRIDGELRKIAETQQAAPEPAKAEQQHPRKTQPKNVTKKNNNKTDGGKGGNKQGKEQLQKKPKSGV